MKRFFLLLIMLVFVLGQDSELEDFSQGVNIDLPIPNQAFQKSFIFNLGDKSEIVIKSRKSDLENLFV